MPDLPAAPSCAKMLKVLADDVRLAVIEQLLEGPKHVGEINEQLGVEQTLLSHHLRVLREAGLVRSQRDGKSVLYRLAPAVEGARRGKAIDLGCCLISFE
jgi:ArsR family transcriptional regulator, nickel/cobalt-responsive transcriptional repressor